MINFENGRSISTVVISSSAGHYGEGVPPYIFFPSYRSMMTAAQRTNTTIFGKSLTPGLNGHVGYVKHPVIYKPWTIPIWIFTAMKYVKSFPDGGKLNTYGLTNDGPIKISRRAKKYFQKGRKIVLNIYPHFSGKTLEEAIVETIQAIEICLETVGKDYFWVIELSYSCPNSKEDISCNMRDSLACTEAIRKRFPWLTIIVKGSIVHPYEYLQEMQKYVDALHLVNTVPFKLAFPGKTSPIPVAGGGGYSGPAVKRDVFRYNREARKKLHLPIIMENSVRTIDDIQTYLDIGANCVGFCTIGTDDSKEAKRIIMKYNT